MPKLNWSEQDYYQAEDHLIHHPDEPQATPLVDCGEGVSALLPLGLPALGIRWQAILVLSPIPMLLLWLLWVLGMGIPALSDSAARWGIVALSLILIAGLIRVTFYLFNNRNLFPRKYFVTVSDSGVAMHFSRVHFPFLNPRGALRWNEIDSIQPSTTFFLPALMMFRAQVPCLRLSGNQGQTLAIPFRIPGASHTEATQAVLQLLESRFKK